MNNYWSAIVNNLDPYVPGEQTKLSNVIKLNTNENPYGPSYKVLDAIKNSCNNQLRLYPDPESISLRDQIASLYNLNIDNIFVGNGSDEVLAQSFLAFFQKEKPIIFPDITYSFYKTYCQLFNIAYKTIPLDEYFNIKISDYLPKIHKNYIGGIIFPNPNAPTGINLELTDVEKIISSNKNIVVVIDEAYVDFGSTSAVSLINKYDNLLIVQTFSKSRSLAGLRIGFAIGNKNLINGLIRVKNSFNSYPVDKLASIGAIAAFQDIDYFNFTCNSIIKLRNNLINDMINLGFEVLPSKANFIFAKHNKYDAKIIYEKLKDNNILVRHFNKDRINQYLRISIGIEEHLSQLIYILNKIVNN
ncbi:Histidinol-phosphate aminotransferase [Candidatus Kinetoplastibacterium sorsogonicusi]|uniref:Histidinol-phosphate aminotransferase n=1 Tax=Candidatus Kinetoplastidibacterium kentomonadis TaxID=1576550 RepID=A0A3S7J9Z9_9PROT|nr:histidinol-phosphate transaminase [Candidatus Kinetoplastibacterium sorsogonicusi]AWD32489.1 Histidinol-phosphate aminotransferase [Candidatus Kinetoplastibacterium sorsogonicusi]